MFIIMEGFDKTFKTSIIKHMGKYNQWEQIYIDRGPAGYIFYDELLKRVTYKRYVNYIQDARQMGKLDYVVVFLKSAPEDILLRHELHNEVCLLNSTRQILEAQERYEKLINVCYDGPVLTLNTSELNIDECCKKIMNLVAAHK